MKSRFLLGGALLAFSVGALLSARADVKLPPIFSDHAVLQKSAKVPVWGTADADEPVTVTLEGVEAKTKAGADGKWRVELDLSSKGEGPYELVVQGKNKITLTDVLVGDVWVCSGQSNMEWTMGGTIGAKEEIERSANPKLRHFLVRKGTSITPLETFEGAWTIAGPETTAKMTAVGYYFGKALNTELKKPIGLVHTSWGGTHSEAWTSIDSCDKDADLKATKDRMHNDFATYPERQKAYVPAYQEWSKTNARDDKPSKDADFAGKDVSTADWKKIELPNAFAKVGVPDSGVIWLRKTVTVPENLAKKDLKVALGIITGFDSVYWNGEKIGITTPATGGAANGREYNVPGRMVNAGEAVIAVRIFAPAGGAGLAAPQWISNFRFGPGNTPLKGEWLAKAETELPALSAEAQASYPKPIAKSSAPHNIPAFLYNAMINPVIPYAITGAIWYQGESNAGRAENYGKVFPLMITDWRTHWGQGDFPFYFCQLANFDPKQDAPGESNWAELREAQTKTLSLPNTGMAVLIDIGESLDIHPRNKKDAGERLAKYALAKTYGKDIAFSGPKYKAMSVDGNKVVLTFENTNGGLTAPKVPETYDVRTLKDEKLPTKILSPGSELQGFAICGEDKVWKWAQAKIEKDTVVVWSDDVAKPIAVRYAWANNPTCNLYNGAGFPAIPFRTDNFKLNTTGNKL